ncbi:MAG TPA: hypothetical protein VHW71_04635 [Steroidobacteraceae bacterium]|jgi:hypothetical protein|nr:hypothetical protein [Steroidobacteraceae bacterium]
MPIAAVRPDRPCASSWFSRREATLNWLALGLLLAAWNASDNDAPARTRSRPEALRGYAHVSVRAANRAARLER